MESSCDSRRALHTAFDLVRYDDMSIRKTSEDSVHSQGETVTRYSVSCQDYVSFPLVFQLPGCAAPCSQLP